VNCLATAFQTRRVAKALSLGDVVAAPAEAVWGLSCDPWSLDAVEALCAMKRRALDKGLIVVSWTPLHFEPLLQTVPTAARRQCLDSWPAPITWVVPNNGYFPPWVTGDSNEVAIRVTAAPALVALSKAIDGPIVSTSANAAGALPARHGFQVTRYFGEKLKKLPGTVDLMAKPSTIKRITTGDVLR
jgi:L-threonylcarbamoyladenylate synthase